MTRRRARRTLADVGEQQIVSQLTADEQLSAEVITGPGDDCAHLRLAGRDWIWTTDSQIEGTHFESSWMTPQQVGAKAYLVNASDIAAMGGRPRFALVSLAAPETFPARGMLAVQRGIREMAERDEVSIVGGNVARSPLLAVTVSLLGESPRHPVLRSGARAGDSIYVSGTLGDAALGLRRLRADAKATGSTVQRFRRPQPRLRAGAVLAARRVASAMIDVSDGLAVDLERLCLASDVGARIDAGLLPVSRAVARADRSLALHGGEDYELLCAVPARKEKFVAEVSADLGCSMTRIGVFCDADDGIVVAGLPDHARRAARGVAKGGFSHFSHNVRIRG